MDLASLTYEAAKALEGTAFRVELGNGTAVSLRLDEARSLESRPRGRERKEGAPRREPFALYFRGPRTPILPQAIYALRADTVTFEQLFIVPVGQGEEGTEYEAIFT
jgi:hypothetical protein